MRDVATALLDRGHTPVAYSTHLGDVARELKAIGIPVVDRLDAMAVPPDLIHGHHNLDLMTALLHFSGVPAICFCHGVLPWQEAPLRFPRVRHYVAVSVATRDKLLYEHAIPEDRIRVLYNFVDLKRFRPRGALPRSPKRALVFSNYASDGNFLGVVREACSRLGFQLDAIGLSLGNACARPEDILGEYDLVFARGRCALEALAVGAAVILCDIEGAGPMVTTGNMELLQSLNFGLRALREPVEVSVLTREIARYDPAESARVSRWVRETAGRDAAVDKLIALYQEVISDYAATEQCDVQTEQRAAADYLRWLAPLLKNGYSLEAELNHLNQALTEHTSRNAEITNHYLHILQSKSWRYTKPVRQAIELLVQCRQILRRWVS